jgi:phosphohistidine phosphatase SixA
MKTSLALGLAMVALSCVQAQAQPTLVVVVRHAEAAAEPQDDPALSAAGAQRAQALATHLENAKLSAIVTTQLRRTQETAAPTALKFGIQPQVVAARRGESEAHIAEVVALVRQLTGGVLVVGHSNTVPAIVGALSGTTVVPLCHGSHSHLFMVSLSAAANPVRQLRVGQADPTPAANCQ